MLHEVYKILHDLRPHMNHRALVAAIERRWMSGAKWRMLLDSDRRTRWPRFWFSQGVLALACADTRLDLFGVPVRRETKFADLFKVAQARDPIKLTELASRCGIGLSTLYNYRKGREPQFWIALKIADKYPDGLRVTRVRDWFFEFADPMTPGAFDRHAWNELLRRRLAGDSVDALAKEYGVEASEVERLSERVAASRPDLVGALLRGGGSPEGDNGSR